MSVIRAFIAINLSEEILRGLSLTLAELKKRMPGIPVRWVPVENIHLTLKFLGDVSIANLELLTKILRAEAARQSPFELSVGGLGAFPSVRRPRVIWAGVEAPAELGVFQRSVEAEMARLGYPPEDRPFSPHLTLGRVLRNANSEDIRQIGNVIEGYKVGFLGATRVRAVHLFRSDLKPGGAVYTRIFSANLGDMSS